MRITFFKSNIQQLTLNKCKYTSGWNQFHTSRVFFTLSLLDAFLLKLLANFTGSGQWLYSPPYSRLSLGSKVSAQRRHILSLQHVNNTLHTAPLGIKKVKLNNVTFRDRDIWVVQIGTILTRLYFSALKSIFLGGEYKKCLEITFYRIWYCNCPWKHKISMQLLTSHLLLK